MLYLLKTCEKHREHQMALSLLAYGLRREYGIRQLPAIGRQSLGKPYFPEYPDIYFNYSHSPFGILLGLHNKEIGVDIQGRIVYKERLARRICHPREQERLGQDAGADEILTRLWTAKESYLKYTGEGIRRDLRQIDCSECLQGHGRVGNADLYSFMEREFGWAVCCEGRLPKLFEVKWEEL